VQHSVPPPPVPLSMPPPPPMQFFPPEPLSISNFQPAWQFVLLNLATCGIYALIWFYRNWSLLTERLNLHITPFWRMIFAPFFTVSFYRTLDRLMGYEAFEERTAAPVLGGLFGISSLLWLILDRSLWSMGEIFFSKDARWIFLASLFCLLISTFALLPAVRTLNAFWRAEQAGYPERRRLNGWALAVIIIGFLRLLDIFAYLS